MNEAEPDEAVLDWVIERRRGRRRRALVIGLSLLAIVGLAIVGGRWLSEQGRGSKQRAVERDYLHAEVATERGFEACVFGPLGSGGQAAALRDRVLVPSRFETDLEGCVRAAGSAREQLGRPHWIEPAAIDPEFGFFDLRKSSSSTLCRYLGAARQAHDATLAQLEVDVGAELTSDEVLPALDCLAPAGPSPVEVAAEASWGVVFDRDGIGIAFDESGYTRIATNGSVSRFSLPDIEPRLLALGPDEGLVGIERIGETPPDRLRVATRTTSEVRATLPLAIEHPDGLDVGAETWLVLGSRRDHGARIASLWTSEDAGRTLEGPQAELELADDYRRFASWLDADAGLALIVAAPGEPRTELARTLHVFRLGEAATDPLAIRLTRPPDLRVRIASCRVTSGSTFAWIDDEVLVNITPTEARVVASLPASESSALVCHAEQAFVALVIGDPLTLRTCGAAGCDEPSVIADDVARGWTVRATAAGLRWVVDRGAAGHIQLIDEPVGGVIERWLVHPADAAQPDTSVVTWDGVLFAWP